MARWLSLVAGVLVLALMFLFVNVNRQPAMMSGEEIDKPVSFFTDYAEFDIELIEQKLLEKGYQNCGDYVLREGVNYIKFEYSSPEPIACYIKLKRESNDLAHIFSITHVDMHGPFKGTKYQSIGNSYRPVLDLVKIPDPFSQFVEENISVTFPPGGLRPEARRPISLIDSIRFFSYEPRGYKSYVSIQITVVSAKVDRFPSWVSGFDPGRYYQRWQRGDWTGYLKWHYFLEECGTYDIDPSRDRITFTYTVKPTGAMCYFTLNIPAGVKLIPERTLLKLQASHPVNVAGNAFVVFDAAIVTPKRMGDAMFSNRAVGFGKSHEDQFVKDLLSGKPVLLGLRRHIELGDSPLVVPFIMAIAANSQLSGNIPDVNVEITILYTIGK